VSYIAPPYVRPPVTPTLPPFKPGGVHILNLPGVRGPFAQSADGNSFTTDLPFTVADYAIARGLDQATAEAVLDQAVLDGRAAVT
jgi:hypothetical protein